MGKTGGIVGLIGGIFAAMAAVFTLTIGGVGAAFEAKQAGAIVDFGWYGLASSFLVIVFAAVAITKPSVGSFGLLVMSAVGAVVGGSFVAICLVLAWLGGVLAAIGVRSGTGTRVLWQWTGLPIGIIAAIAIALASGGPSTKAASAPAEVAVPVAAPVAPTIPSLGAYVGQHPIEVFKDTAVKAKFQNLLGKDYEQFITSLSVSDALSESSNFYFGSGCMAHACDEAGSAFTISKSTGAIAAAMLTKGGTFVAFGADNIRDMPAPLHAWYIEQGGQ